MAHDIQFVTNNGVWMREVPHQHPEESESISEGTLLPAIQPQGNTVSRDTPGDEINNAWLPLVSSSVMVFGAGDRFSHMPDHGGEEEGKLCWKYTIAGDFITLSRICRPVLKAKKVLKNHFSSFSRSLKPTMQIPRLDLLTMVLQVSPVLLVSLPMARCLARDSRQPSFQRLLLFPEPLHLETWICM